MMKYNRQAFCDLKDKEKLKIVKEELSVVTHNGVTKDDLLMLLDWTYNRLVKGDLNDVTDINVGSNDDWTPTEERQPEKPVFGEDSYIVQTNNIITPFSAFWNGEEWTDESDNKVKGVIAWQPPPKRYKGK